MKSTENAPPPLSWEVVISTYLHTETDNGLFYMIVCSGGRQQLKPKRQLSQTTHITEKPCSRISGAPSQNHSRPPVHNLWRKKPHTRTWTPAKKTFLPTQVSITSPPPSPEYGDICRLCYFPLCY